ncbi:DUF3017 domain-containing protein [Streptomyces sp. H27-C3]|uniref:DUF3017 domain-containing protein n=1 Tax=Streptomyces sp. H27-C3 TaxID=3046305 RepID=UPI0024BB6053|nr:DUF3017 domain-containing protein [Streptomyces sp. H27-C3]MDJ0464042.1 DUF3017 domain-containing protein [Streptomyces sp. H27-C3]
MSEREALPMGAGTSRDATPGKAPDATSGAGGGAEVTPDVASGAGADVTPDAAPGDRATAAGSPADADGPAEASEGEITAGSSRDPAGTSPDSPGTSPDAAATSLDAAATSSGSPDPAGSSPDPAGSSPDPAGEAAPESTRDVEADLAEPESKGVVSVPSPEGPVRSTRRFPLLTRDTARPEGGGRAAPGGAAAPVRQWPFLAVMGATAFGLLLVAVDPFEIGFRLGTLLIGLSLIGGAVMRRLIHSVGMLAVRSRFTDMVTYGLLGVVISLLALMAQPKPWLEIPFLEAVVRFTVR